MTKINIWHIGQIEQIGHARTNSTKGIEQMEHIEQLEHIEHVEQIGQIEHIGQRWHIGSKKKYNK